MTSKLQQLLLDTVDLTGTPPPEIMSGRAPILVEEALSETGFYLVGFIGGKEVGKSSLVNALVGEAITSATSFGPGTETVIAYAHDAQVPAVKLLLEKEVPGQYKIVSHRISSLAGQVLMDLPDIDSHYASHIEVTRRMLRHMLFPLWMQSVEKYADLQPQQLLAEVASGNSASNFLFCLNKADQLHTMSGGSATAAEELRADFSQRLGRTLSIAPPRVWLLSAVSPHKFDLQELRELLSRPKSNVVVQQSQAMAKDQQDRSVLLWIDAQDLPARAQRLLRLEEEATELLAGRVGNPILEKCLTDLAEDPASRLALTDEVLTARVAHWPVVNLVHMVLTPISAIVRRNIGAVRTGSLPDAEALVDAHLRPGGTRVTHLVQTTFAMLQQANPRVSELYSNRRLWEEMSADAAAVKLRFILAGTLERQRGVIREKLAGRSSVIFAPIRWLLTIGALIWFPLIQPVLDTLLKEKETYWNLIHDTHEIVVLVVRVFSVNELLENLEFLAMYFFVLWVVLRWHTNRQINRFASRWKSDSSELSLIVQTLGWLDDLLSPIHVAKARVDDLIKRRNDQL